MAAESNDLEPREFPPLSTAQRRKIQRCYDHGCALVQEAKHKAYDHDYVNTMFSECVATDPGNLVYVEAFLDNLGDKFNNSKRGGRLGFNARGNLKKLVAKAQWDEVLSKGLDILRQNPWDKQTLRWMAQACAVYRFNEVELRYLKNALDANPKDIEVNKHCAHSLARMGQFEQSIACWHRIEELDKNNKEAPEMISKLSVERHRIAAGLVEEASPEIREKVTAAAKPHAASERAEDEQAPVAKREIKLTARQQMEQTVVNEPTNTDAYMALAELHSREGRYQDAEQVLSKALTAAGKDLKIQEKLEDTMILRAKSQLAVAEARAKEKQTQAAAELAEQVRENLYRLEMEILNARSQRFPEDQQLKFDLAVRLKKLGNHEEAMSIFREARGDENLKPAATIEMGECLQHLKQYSKALQCYQKAIDAASRLGKPELKKLALYRAGVLAAGLKQTDVARTHLQELVKLDAKFKDAQSRLDKLG